MTTNEAVLREALENIPYITCRELQGRRDLDGEYFVNRGRMLEALAATATVASADDTFMLKREIHNLKRHIEDYCPAPVAKKAMND